MQEELANNERANVAVSIEVVVNEPGRYVFWVRYGGDRGPWSARKHQCGNLDELRALGFEAKMDPDTHKLIAIDLGKGWLAHRNCELLDIRNGVFLLRKTDSQDFPEQPSDVQ